MNQQNPIVGTEETPNLNFIRDEATTEDAFRSHTRVAKAITAAIRMRPDLKVVGLLGPWGSGKSTVLKITQTLLAEEKAIQPYCFSYDAWLHQNDPPRRSFLETLVHFLQHEKLSDASTRENWKKRLDRLNRRVEEWENTSTPSLTSAGKILIWSLFLLPLATQFVAYEWFEKATTKGSAGFERWAFPIGFVLLLLPLLLTVGIYIWWRPLASPFRKKFWRTHRGRHEGESIISLIMNKEVQKSRHRITRDLDPTTIEFQDIFREIMDAVSGLNRRFIFIVDNLDRLPEAEAVSMWATIRSFFLGALETEHVRRLMNPPTVILPIDENAVRRMYQVSHGDDADALARSFMDKTFDLTFRVTRPVLSDWNAFLGSQMRTVFGAFLGDDWSMIVGNLYDEHVRNSFDGGTNDSVVITPRSINTLVNDIAVLWLQWRSEPIRFASIAYYAINRETVDADILAAITVGNPTLASFDRDWQASLASLHYGVEPPIGLQIAIDRQLNDVFFGPAVAGLDSVRTIPGFELVLQRVIDRASQTDGINPDFALNAASIVDGISFKDETRARAVWRTLTAMARVGSPWKDFDEKRFKAVDALGRHSEDPSAFIDMIADQLGSANPSSLDNSGSIDIFSRIGELLLSLAQSNGVELTHIRVPGPPEGFLAVSLKVANNLPLLKVLEPSVPDADVAAKLAADLAEGGGVEKSVRALIARGRDFPWGPLANAACKIIKEENAAYPGMEAALACLGLLQSRYPEVKSKLAEIVASGQLENRINEAHSVNRIGVEARCLALLMLTNSTCPAPAGVSWDKAVIDRPDLAADVDSAVTDYDPTADLKNLIEVFKGTPDAQPLIQLIVSKRLREGRMGPVETNHIINNLKAYRECVENDLRKVFVENLAHSQSFWEELEKAELDENINAVLHVLIAEGSADRRRASGIAKQKLDGTSTSAWEAAIRNGGEPLTLALAVRDADRSLHLGTTLFEALRNLVPELTSGWEPAVGERWFGASVLLSSNARQTMYRNLRDRLTSGEPISSLLDVLNAGGGDFLQEGRFDESADESVRHIIVPLLASSDGVVWLTKQSAQTAKWVSGGASETRHFLLERLSDLFTSSDETAKAQFEGLRSSWSLPEFVSESKDTEVTQDPN